MKINLIDFAKRPGKRVHKKEFLCHKLVDRERVI